MKLFIQEDSTPEGDEYVFVYLAPQTDGVRVAQPSLDFGLKASPISNNSVYTCTFHIEDKLSEIKLLILQ